MESLSFSYTYTLADYEALQHRVCERSPLIQRSRVIRRTVLPMAGVAVAALKWPRGLLFPTMLCLALSLAWLTLWPWYFDRRRRRMITAATAQAQSGACLGRHAVVIDGPLIHCTFPGGCTQTPVTAITSITDTPEHLFLWHTTYSAFTLPTRALGAGRMDSILKRFPDTPRD
jgi:hypothetical protein